MPSLAWIVVALAVAVGAQRDAVQVPLPGGSAATAAKARGAGPCTAQCVNDFAADDKAPELVSSCQTGCRFLAIIESVELFPGPDMNGTLKNCNTSCGMSFHEASRASACQAGCALHVPIVQKRRKEITGPLDAFFGGGDIFPSFDRAFSGLSDSFSNGAFSNMFNDFQRQVNNMMTGMMSEVNGDLANAAEENLPKGSHGKLVVIKSGPGMRSEKVYDLGPDGKFVQTYSKNDGENNDMMNKANPLDQDFDRDEVEVFNAPEQKSEDDGNIKKHVVDLDLVFPRHQDSNVQEFDLGDFDQNFVEGPRLPEEGLKTRFNFVGREQLCAENSHNQRWSDWISCLHMRMGVPRWLTAATLCLAVIFIIWLCLVIPANAPKQRVKMTKAMEASLSGGEKGTLALVTPTFQKLDLPPSYDDVANLYVAIPVAREAHAEAGPLPDKKPLEASKV